MICSVLIFFRVVVVLYTKTRIQYFNISFEMFIDMYYLYVRRTLRSDRGASLFRGNYWIKVFFARCKFRVCFFPQCYGVGVFTVVFPPSRVMRPRRARHVTAGVPEALCLHPSPPTPPRDTPRRHSSPLLTLMVISLLNRKSMKFRINICCSVEILRYAPDSNKRRVGVVFSFLTWNFFIGIFLVNTTNRNNTKE